MANEGLKEVIFDQVFDSQRNFRVLMDGMSRPGEAFKLCNHSFSRTPEGFNPNFLTVLKTLGDIDVSYALCNMEGSDIQKYIEVNTGMRQEEIQRADYVLLNGTEFDRRIFELNTGTLEFPENSATVLIKTESILSGQYKKSFIPNVEVHMRGPGIRDKNIVTFCGLDKRYLQSITEINSVFPLGIDMVILDNEGSITCISRTTRVEVS
jgi:alpha-D-ribose 1-methylphosphonate 5-triphosphate synthase subunit PhnH